MFQKAHTRDQVMQNGNKLPFSVSDFVQLAHHAFAQARANLERARALTEIGETYLESARLAEPERFQDAAFASFKFLKENAPH
jgi:hypothetical protein